MNELLPWFGLRPNRDTGVFDGRSQATVGDQGRGFLQGLHYSNTESEHRDSANPPCQ